MASPLISIITPCYNASGTITQTVESVLAQSFKDWELLIVDDSSTDNSAEIIRKFTQTDPRIKYLHTDSRSGSPTRPRNIGLENARGKYVAFLDADDMWLPEKLEKQLRFMEENGVNFCVTDYEKMNYQGHRNNRIIRGPQKASFWDVIETCSVPCLTVMLSKDLVQSTRFKDVPKEDWVFWMEILKKGVDAYNLPEVLAIYREHNNSRSSNKFKMIKNQWDVLRKVERVKSPVAVYFMIKYLFYGFLKFIK